MSESKSLHIKTQHASFDQRVGFWIGFVGLLFVVFFHNYLWRLARIATDQWGGDWSHVLVIPWIAAYYVYQQREAVCKTKISRNWVGLAMMFLGMFSYAWWIYPGRNDMFQGYSMLVCLFGLLWFLFGNTMMRILWVPVCYMVFAIKVSDRLWETLAWKLQLFAAHASSFILNYLGAFFDLQASVQGSTIQLDYIKQGQWVQQAINVAEACSGLRMLAAFMALGVAVAVFTDRLWWQRGVLVLSTVPIAIAVNIARVTVMGMLYLVDKSFVIGDVHKLIGLSMLGPALLLFLGLGWILDHLLVTELLAESSTPEPSINKPTDQPTSTPTDTSSQSPTKACNGALQIKANLQLARRWQFIAGLLGSILALLLGISYGLFLSSFRPELLGTRVSQPMVFGMLGVAIFLFAACCYFVIRLMRTATQLAFTPASLCAGVLLASTFGLQGVIARTRTVLIKKPVNLQQPLFMISQQIGPWKLINDQRLSPEVLESLRTRNYLLRSYWDTRLPRNAPGAILQLHIAYYTGTLDTVPHVPDRCYVAGGMFASKRGQMLLTLRGPTYQSQNKQLFALSPLSPKPVIMPARDVPLTFLSFVSQRAPQWHSQVFYFFIANGHYWATPDAVRLQGFDLRDRYSYYCKVEMAMPNVLDARQAVDPISEFLSKAMPDIMACLPNWSEVQKHR